MKWFKHDSDASIDAKMQELMLDYGAAGYGLYWYCVELIAQGVSETNVTFELDHDARIIARNLNLSAAETKDMMKKMVDLGLFDISQNQKLACYTMARRLDQSMTSNTKMREIISTIKDNHDSVMIKSCKKRREEKREEENRIEKKKVFTFALNRATSFTSLSEQYIQKLLGYAVLKDGAFKHDEFMDFHVAKGSKFKDWSAAYRTWVKRSQEYDKDYKPEKYIQELPEHQKYGVLYAEYGTNRAYDTNYNYVTDFTVKTEREEVKVSEDKPRDVKGLLGSLR